MTVAELSEHGLWRCHTRVEKFDVDSLEFSPEGWQRALRRGLRPYDVLEVEGNLVVTAGRNFIWDAVRNTASLTYFSSANAAIGTGDSNTPETAAQTDLTAAAGTTHQLRKGMQSGFPSVPSAGSMQFQSQFGGTEGNYVAGWLEWGVFNSATAGAGTMLNRKVESLGVKASGSTWTITVTLSIS